MVANGNPMRSMYALVKSIKEIIDAKVIGLRNLREPATKGDTTIHVAKALLYIMGESIVLSDGEKAEVHKISCIPDSLENPDGLTLHLCEPLQCDYSTTATIQKTFNQQTVTSHIGYPPDLSEYPAITVQLMEADQEPIAIRMYQDTLELSVKVHVSNRDYASNFKLLHDLTQLTEGALFTTWQPLIEPFLETTLTSEVKVWHTSITVNDPDRLTAPMDIYIGDDEKQTYHRIQSYEGNGVYNLVHHAEHHYDAGSQVYSPLIHTYDGQVTHRSYEDPASDSPLLMRSNLTYTVKLARARRAV